MSSDGDPSKGRKGTMWGLPTRLALSRVGTPSADSRTSGGRRGEFEEVQSPNKRQSGDDQK